METSQNIEVMEAVENINLSLTEQLGDENHILLEFSTNSFVTVVSFMDEMIWNSEEDGREWIENEDSLADPISESGDYEPIEEYLRKEVNKLIEKIAKVKL